MTQDPQDKAKDYQRKRVILTLVHIPITFFLLVILAWTGLSGGFRDMALSLNSSILVQVFIYFLLVSLFFLLVDFPLSVYSGYLLEKKYALSNQTFQSWLKETAKKMILSFMLSLALVEVFFVLVHAAPDHWWWMAWLVWIFFTLVLGRLAPVLIFPIFYKFKPLEDEALRTRIIHLVQSNGLKLQNVYSFNMSKTTKKANAAFCGMGKTRRVVLADTLLQNFSPEEIEMVVAHEMGHCKLGHIWKRIIWGAIVSLIAFYLAYQLAGDWAFRLGFDGVQDLAALPLVMLVFFVFGVLLIPLENAYSRKHEYEADAFGYEKSAAKSAFAPLMEKLSRLNLSDPDPHPLIEFILYDHPSIRHRIERIQARSV